MPGEPSLRSPSAPSKPVGVARAQRAISGAVLLAAALIIVGLLVQQLITLLLAVLVTIILSLPLSWSATVFERRGIPRTGGALIGLAIGVGVLGGLIALLVPVLINQVGTLINAGPGLVHTIEVKVSHLTGGQPGHVASQLQQYAATYARDPTRLLGRIASIGLGAATVIGGLVIAIITAYYIAARPQPLLDGTLRLFPPRRRPEVMRVLLRLRAAWLGWLRGLAIAMLIIGVLLYLALHLLVGLPFAVFFAALGAAAEVIPYFGAIASSIPPIAFALTISPGTAIGVLVIYALFTRSRPTSSLRS